MSNIKIGTDFENEFCELLCRLGYYAHINSRSASGSQPFDVHAAKDDLSYHFDCKVVSKGRRFPLSRIEENQHSAFKRLNACRCYNNYIAVYFEEYNCIRLLPYGMWELERFNREASVDLMQMLPDSVLADSRFKDGVDFDYYESYFNLK